MSRAGFTIHLDRCTGCAACRLACRMEHGLGPRSWRSVHSFNAERRPGLSAHHLSLACNHCADAPCMTGCPAAAFDRDATTDAVILHPERCMGCRYCSWVCPYGAPCFDAERGVMEKCTFCVERTRAGDEPACVQACPVEALETLDAVVGNEPVAGGLPRAGIGAALAVVPRARGTDGPEISPRPSPVRQPAAKRVRLSTRALRSEWSLLLFTLVVTGLVAWQVASCLGGPPVRRVPFLVAGVASIAVSTLHLGNPRNAWRAVRNVGSSWVSREIVAVSAFLVGTVVLLGLGVTGAAAHAVVAVAGLLAVGAMDMVYWVRGQRIAAVPHSAMASLTVVLGVGVLVGVPRIVIASLVLKLLLYLVRCSYQLAVPPWLLVARLGVGMAVPIVVWVSTGWWLHPVAVVSLVAGEALDRAQLYAELRFLDPELQIDRDHRSWQSSPGVPG